MKPHARSYVSFEVRPALATLVLVCAPALALAQRTPAPEDILPESALHVDDPIGVDGEAQGVAAAADQADAEAAVRARARDAEAERYGPTPPPARATVGEALTSVRSVRETSHRVDTTLDAGLAIVRVEMAFATAVDSPAEVRYRLPVPAGAQLAALEVCNDLGCRTGAIDRSRDVFGAYDDSVQARGPERALPIAHAVALDDERGRAIVLRAAPVSKGHELRVRLAFVADTPVRGGSARIVLPARGMDPNVAPSEVHFTAPGMLDARVAGRPATDARASFDPWVEVRLDARLAAGAAASARVWTFPCHGSARGGLCARAHVAAGPRDAEARDFVIAVDVSPSTEGPTRGRLLPAIASLLATAPQGSRVRAVAFAARARVLVSEPLDPAALPLSRFAGIADVSDLGSATRFEAVWALVHEWFPRRARRLRPAIVIVGDGGLTAGDARPFARARRAGVEVHVVNLSGRASVPALAEGARSTGGAVIDAGRDADDAGRGEAAALDERIGAVFAPVVAPRVSVVAGRSVHLGGLRAGDALAWEGPVGRAPKLMLGGRATTARAAPPDIALALAARSLTRDAAATADANPPALARGLAAVDARDFVPDMRSPRPPPSKNPKRCDRRGPAWRHGGVSSDVAPVALAEERACRATAKPTRPPNTDVGAGMPADPLLDMLRQRVIPVARGCFRRDRAGRLDYAVRAVFAFTLAEREIVAAEIEGAIDARLRNCLLAAIDTLEVPRFSGLVEVRYPLRTQREPLPKEIELTASATGALDAVGLGAVRDTPPPPTRSHSPRPER